METNTKIIIGAATVATAGAIALWALSRRTYQLPVDPMLIAPREVEDVAVALPCWPPNECGSPPGDNSQSDRFGFTALPTPRACTAMIGPCGGYCATCPKRYTCPTYESKMATIQNTRAVEGSMGIY